MPLLLQRKQALFDMLTHFPTAPRNRPLKIFVMNNSYFFDYVPSRYEVVSKEQDAIRNFILKFKDGDYRSCRYAAWLVCEELLRQYNGAVPKDLVLACVPTSSLKKYYRRFQRFSSMVARRLQIEDAFEHVSIVGFRDAKHTRRDHMVSDLFSWRVDVDDDFFRYKEVVIFDDLFTTGSSASDFRELLEQFGCDVTGGLFLGRTTKGLPFNLKPVGFDSYMIEPVPGVSMNELMENVDILSNY